MMGNDKVCQIREFDIVSGNRAYENSRDLKVIKQEYFEEFSAFVKKNASAEESNQDPEALDFFKAFYKKNVGDVIQAGSYVGLIELGSGYQIEVLPKIDFVDESDPDRSTKSVFIDMLRCLNEFQGKVFNRANLRTEHLSLYEMFINMYAQQVMELTRRGLKSAYVDVEDNLKFYKGKLLISDHIKRNAAHKERFYVSYDEFNQNRPENKLIKATLLKLLRASGSNENVKIIRQLLVNFENIDPSINYEQDFSRVIIDRNTRDYTGIMIWSKVFLMNKSFSTFSGDVNARAILFRMEKIYEAFVAKKMAQVFGANGWEITAQDTSYYLFEEGDKGVFELRPDIVATRDDGHKVIMDTKWKRLSPNKRNYGISQGDIYQMFAYAKKYKTADVWLLYPLTEEMKDSTIITFISKDETGNIDVELHVFFVDVAHIEDSLQNLQNRIKCGIEGYS